MNVNTEEIIPKTCPLCRTVIYRCRRYSAILHHLRADIEQLKIKIYGDPTTILQVQKETFSILFVSGINLLRFKEMKEYLTQFLLLVDKKGCATFLNCVKVQVNKAHAQRSFT
jgi:hypothetical protein